MKQNVTLKTFFLPIPIAHFPAYMVYFRQTGITVVHTHHNKGGRNDEKAHALAGTVSGSGRGTVLRPDRERIGKQTRRSEKGDRRKVIKEKIEQLKEEFEIPDLDTDAILSSFATAATSGDFGENNCLHWEVSTGVFSGKTLTISGTGAMPNFDFPHGNLAPWWNL